MLKNPTVIGEKDGKALTLSQLKSNPLNLRYVSDQTNELCMLAVQHCHSSDFAELFKAIPEALQDDKFWVDVI